MDSKVQKRKTETVKKGEYCLHKIIIILLLLLLQYGFSSNKKLKKIT